MKRRLWTAVIALGVLLILGAAGLAVWNLNTDREAAESSEELLEELVQAMPEPETAEAEPQAPPNTQPPEDPTVMPTLPVDGRNYIGAISFPALGRELPVLADFSMDALKIAPAVYSGTVAGEDLVICGHNYRSHFGPINRLDKGAEVVLVTVDGTVHRYTVAATEVVSPFAVADVTSGEWDLTIFTCTLGGRTRFVLRCDLSNGS